MENTLVVQDEALLADVGKAMLAMARVAVAERQSKKLTIGVLCLQMQTKLTLIRAKLCNNEDIRAELDGLSDLVAELGTFEP